MCSKVKPFQRPVFGNRDLLLDRLMNTSVNIPATWWLHLRDTGDDGLGCAELALQGRGPSVHFLCVLITLVWRLTLWHARQLN